MSVLGKAVENFASIGRDRRGNFTYALAALLPVIMIAGAIGTDYTSAMALRGRITDAADAAAAAAAAAMLNDGTTELQAEKIALAFFQAQMESDGDTFGTFDLNPSAKVKTVIDANGNEVYQVSVNSNAIVETNQITKTMFSNSLNIQTGSYAESSPESIASLSMFLVLDKSGSMGWDNKMDSLKTAVGKLMIQLDTAEQGGAKGKGKGKKNNNKKYVRTGAIAYDSNSKKPEEIDWGTDDTVAYTNGLKAGGGTNSSNAMKLAWKRVRDPSEKNAHKKENGKDPGRYIVFMTDGDNNKKSYDTKTKKWCNKAKGENITIYSVAFKAPTGGQKLLQACATDAGHYFDAQSSEELIKAFEKIGQDAASKMARITK